MNKRWLFALGIIFLLLGCISNLYLGVIISSARIAGPFATIVTDAPINAFDTLRCPFLIKKGETASIVVTIANPTLDPLDYTVRIETNDFSIRSPAERQQVTVAGDQTVEVRWVVAAMESGSQALAVEAVSNQDLALPGPFHSWPTSFRESCGVRVINGPLTGALTLLVSLAGTAVGIALTALWVGGRIRERFKGQDAE